MREPEGARLARRRMHNQRLWGPPLARPEDAVALLGAVQAQDYAGAKWSLGCRTAGVTDAAVEAALDEGTILRTHVLRPTWHFVLPSEIRWLLELTAARVHAVNAPYYRQQDLDGDVLRKSRRVVERALEGGNHLTRDEIRVLLAGNGIAASGLRLALIVMNAELEGAICSGARRGRRHTYALLEERAPAGAAPARGDAVRELVVRYFGSHGPATVKDLRWWSSLRIADLRDGIDAADDALRHEVVDGVSYWSGPEPGPRRSPRGGARLLQGFDEYLVAYAETKHVFDVAGAAAALPDRRPLATGAVVVGTQLRGHWKRTLKRDEIAVEVVLFAAPSDEDRIALEAAARDLG